MRPIAIDLFSGVGGISLGLEQAGFDVACAVEYDPVHAACHLFNFPRCDMIVDSVTNVTGERIRRATRVKDARVALVVGGPPCQGFSMMGKRAIDDPRNSLVKDYVRIVREIGADYFVFENVKGITVGKHKAILEEVFELFDACGYDVVLPYRVLNVRDYSVPQSRERLIVLGYRKGLKAPSYPAATGAPVTCLDAIGDLPNIDAFAALLETDSVAHEPPTRLSAYAEGLRPSNPDAWRFGEVREWNPCVLTSSRRTVHSELSASRFAATREGEVEPVSRFFRLPRAGVSNTLRAGTDSKRGAFTSPRPVHYEHPRCISVREMARLHGFPDWFRMHVTKWHGARQVGNAVPPPLARAVGLEVMRALGATPKAHRGEALALGAPSLLSFTSESACRYFGVRSLVGTRDRDATSRAPKENAAGEAVA